MRPSAKVIQEAIRGRMVIRMGSKCWQAFATPEHLTFAGDREWTLVAPNGKEWRLLVNKLDPRPMVYSL